MTHKKGSISIAALIIPLLFSAMSSLSYGLWSDINNVSQPVIFNDPLPKQVLLDVPFTSQAPTGDWGMPYQEACEEASLIMAKHYLSGEPLDADHAIGEILEMVAYEENNGFMVDIGVDEVLHLANEFYDLEGRIIRNEDVTAENIKKILAAGDPIIIPAAGRLLGNPHFSGEGPEYHMLVIVGYDENGFITNDPGTMHGRNYKYDFDVLINAIHDWTGDKKTITGGEKAMVVLDN